MADDLAEPSLGSTAASEGSRGSGASICDRFDKVADRFPGRLAVCDLASELTYQESAALVERIAASAALAAGERPGPIAILLPGEVRLPAAMLGVLASGRAYLPLDPQHPLARNRAIMAHAGIAAVVSAGRLARELRAALVDAAPVVNLDALPHAGDVAPIRPGGGDLCQIAYTSGSTGEPKGVVQDHRGMLYSIEQRIRAADIACEDRIAFTYAPGVAAGTLHMFSALLSGASLHILPPQVLAAAGLVREMRTRRITLQHCVPTLFRRMAAALPPGERFESLRLLRLGGERVDWSDYDLFRRACAPDARLIVGLASTEATLYAHWFVDEAVRAESPRLPVGRPVPGYRVTIVREDGTPAPVGEVGELVVRSPYVALGYWNEPELTQRRFEIDPADPRTRTFRTGDLGLCRPGGLFEFLGRKDEQIKLRGHRMELGEIEGALRRCTGVLDAAVAVRRNETGAARALVAYVELAPGVRGMLPRHVMAMASRLLPREVAPAAVVLVDRLPRLPNLKLDRTGLAALDAQRAGEKPARRRPLLVDEVAAVFKDVLSVARASPDDSLASLGGDSLQAVDLALALEKRFGVSIPPGQLEAAQTVGALARWIAARRRSATSERG
jgi:amino acid adenylation domain-containing protein